jgi:hypothetical protein
MEVGARKVRKQRYSFSIYKQEPSAADTEDIEIDDDHFMSFCIKFK